MEIEIWKIFASFGIPGLAIGMLYMLFRQFHWHFPKVSKNWVGPIVILFMIIVGGITFYALTLWAPMHNDSQLSREITAHTNSELLNIAEESVDTNNKRITLLFSLANSSSNTKYTVSSLYLTGISAAYLDSATYYKERIDLGEISIFSSINNSVNQIKHEDFDILKSAVLVINQKDSDSLKLVITRKTSDQPIKFSFSLTGQYFDTHGVVNSFHSRFEYTFLLDDIAGYKLLDKKPLVVGQKRG